MRQIHPRKPWEEWEIEKIRKEYLTEGPNKIAQELGRSYQSVVKRANHMGIFFGDLSGDQLTKIGKIQKKKRATYLEKKREEAKKYTKEQIEEEGRRKRERSIQLSIAANKKRTLYFQEKRVCIRCGEPSLPHNKNYCEIHWIWTLCSAHKMGKMEVADKLLEKLKQQDYKCAITGEQLISGLNASIDHTIAKSRGGDPKNTENIQWVTKHVNRAKQEFTTEEFIDFCRAVIEGYEKKKGNKS